MGNGMNDKSVDTAKSAIKFFYDLEESGVDPEELLDVAIYLAVLYAKNQGHEQPVKIMARLFYLWKKIEKMQWLLNLKRY